MTGLSPSPTANALAPLLRRLYVPCGHVPQTRLRLAPLLTRGPAHPISYAQRRPRAVAPDAGGGEPARRVVVRTYGRGVDDRCVQPARCTVVRANVRCEPGAGPRRRQPPRRAVVHSYGRDRRPTVHAMVCPGSVQARHRRRPLPLRARLRTCCPPPGRVNDTGETRVAAAVCSPVPDAMPHLRLLRMMLQLHCHRLLRRDLQWHPRRRAAPCVRARAAVRQRVRPCGCERGVPTPTLDEAECVPRAHHAHNPSPGGARGAEGVEGGGLVADTRERDAPAMPGGGLRIC